MNDEFAFARRLFRRLLRLLVPSPLAALALGLFVLVSGSAVCEYYMITLGRTTDAYLPWMFGTIVIGFFIWIVYFLRCFDFRWWRHDGWRFKIMALRPLWFVGFVISSYTCLCVLYTIFGLECVYVKVNPAEFAIDTEAFTTIVTEFFKPLFWQVIPHVGVVAVVSWFALREDESRDKLADQMGLLYR